MVGEMVDSSLCSDAFSGMVTKKGRFGTDPYINFLKKGTAKTKALALRERVGVRDSFLIQCVTFLPYGILPKKTVARGSVPFMLI